MTTQLHWQRIKALFGEALQLTPAAREAWLRAQCPDEPALLREVLDLLAVRNASDDILDDNAIDLLRRLQLPQPAQDRLGQRIGAYRLLRLIGEGGMGQVFLAEREDGDFAQQVALKLIRADFVSAETRSRFLRERDLLARLVHPHIAQLHDGGVAGDGTPYFTLEYVAGQPLTRYCDSHALGIRARLRLILQICDAVAYAHRNLIVHRDLKPSNILVSSDGNTKLLDFGIAKLLDADNTGGGTATQARLMTPEYAAPEQVLGEPITTATDVYAIGVLLYELLCGRLPYGRAVAGSVSWAKALVEDAPDTFGRALGRSINTALADSTTLAAARGTTLPALRRSLRGDLDRIVQRALAKAPEARYAAVSDLALDLQAVLDGRAISGSSTRYRLRKFARRHWLPLTAAATIALVLIASTAAVLWQAREVARAARTTLAVKDFLFGLFAAVDPHEAKGREITAHELLDRGAQRIDRNGALDAMQKAEIEAALGRIYYQLGLFDQAGKLQDSAIALLSADPAQTTLLVQSLAERSDTANEVGDLKGAAAQAQHAGELLAGVADASTLDRARVLEARANVAKNQRDFATAARYAEAGLALARQPGMDPTMLFRALMTSGGASWGQSQYETAEAYFREALALALRDAGPDDLDVAKARENTAMVLQSRSHYAEAEQFEQQALASYEKIVGPDHPLTMSARRDLALSLYHQGRYPAARAGLERVLAAQRARLGAEHPALAGTEINLGLVLTDSGNLDAAAQVLADAVTIFTRKYGADYQGARIALGDLAAVHMLQGKLDLALGELEDIRAAEKRLGLPEMDASINDYRVGEVKRLQGDASAAVELQRAALVQIRKSNAEASRHVAIGHQYFARALRDSGDVAGAEGEYRAALASYAGYIPKAAHPLAATTRLELGQLLITRPDTRAEGLHLLDEALQLRIEFLGADEPRTQAARAALTAAQTAVAR